jgi:hypothetical protein
MSKTDEETYCDTNAGRIEFDNMTDEEALFVAKDLRRMGKRWGSERAQCPSIRALKGK